MVVQAGSGPESSRPQPSPCLLLCLLAQPHSSRLAAADVPAGVVPVVLGLANLVGGQEMPVLMARPDGSLTTLYAVVTFLQMCFVICSAGGGGRSVGGSDRFCQLSDQGLGGLGVDLRQGLGCSPGQRQDAIDLAAPCCLQGLSTPAPVIPFP